MTSLEGIWYHKSLIIWWLLPDYITGSYWRLGTDVDRILVIWRRHLLQILAIGWCRKNKVPCLGVCLGMQCAVIEFARNELGWTDANSTEFAPETRHPVILDMPEFNPDEKGGTMRLGRRKTLFRVQNSLMRTMYGNLDSIDERHRHRFEVNPSMVPDLEQRGLRFTGKERAVERKKGR